MSEGNRIVVVGSLNADFVVKMARYPRPGETVVGTGFSQFPGGKGANQAYAAARLEGAPPASCVAMFGQVGADAYGPWLKESLASAGVDVSGVVVDPETSTGIAVISIDQSGQNQIVLVPGANGTFGIEALRRCERRIADADVLLLQLEVPLDTVSLAARMAKANGTTVILDPAPARELPNELIAAADYLTPNETELATLDSRPPAEDLLSPAEATAAARRLRARGAGQVVVKMGSQGALLVGREGETFIPALKVPVVDTTGAGDCFNGAFAVALAEGKSDLEAVHFASAAAAISVTRQGAQPSMPNRQEVLVLMTAR